MKTLFQIRKILITCLFACLVVFTSCDDEFEADIPGNGNDSGNNGGGNNTAGNFTPDELSGFLLLKDFPRIITGKLPPAPNLELGMSIKDTLYMMKEFYGTRVLARHNGSHAVTGFYIAVSDSSYFDVSAVEAESEEFYSVFYIDLVFPPNANVDYPYSTPIKIQPHGPDGEPLNEFDTVITIEDPEDKDPEDRSLSIIGDWEWEATLFADETGDYFFRTAEAPNMIFDWGDGTVAGCCDGGYSTSNFEDPDCYSGVPSWTHVPDPGSFWVTHEELMFLYSNGSVSTLRTSTENYRNPLWTNYCKGEVAYNHKTITSLYFAVHDFNPGNSTISFTISNDRPPIHYVLTIALPGTDPPTRFDSIPSTPRSTTLAYNGQDIIYTPNSLAITFPANAYSDKRIVMYRKVSVNIQDIPPREG